MSAPTGGAEDLAARLTGLVQALRGHGLRIGTGETADAAAALQVLGLAEREHVREGLAAALLRTDRQRAVFDAVFDLYFPLGVGTPHGTRPLDEEPADRAATIADLRERLALALAAADTAATARLAGEAVEALGRYGAAAGPGAGSGPGSGQGGRPGSDGWSAYQTLDRLRPETLLARVLAALRADGSGRGADGAAGFTDRLTEDEIRRRIRAFRAQVGTEARRRVAEVRGTERIAERAVAPTPDRVDFLAAGADQLAELRRTVRPLARKLATRLAARRRRAARGRIDLRRTLRRSLSTGGVPLRPAYRRRRPARPEIVLLCDVSGSVAGFANFTMLLVRAMRDQFTKVRVFAFVNRTDEVTRLVAGDTDPAGLGRRILTEAAVAGWHGSSDYGAALGEFAERYPDAVGPRTAVLVLGDARTNGWDPNLPALQRIADRARRVIWLNPEQASLWGTGDSAALAYAGVVDMHACRNARRLGELVGRLLPV
ncbi:VWA domain-containing protein [Kitasatospora sp. KL5]|uniref:VWA domain-containing protein n=1 Tax=Kitasatospora sp. KL5 TaxID=3425125 RepID=UPI003D6E0C15